MIEMCIEWEKSIRINKVTTLLVEEVQNTLCGFLVTFSHEALPGIAKVHGAQT